MAAMARASVLLADDHEIVAEGLATLLQREFSLVGTVASGAELVEAARRLRPDVIVADVTMPGMSGLEALRRLKADGLASKVVFLTMHADAELAAAALRAGASGFVVKRAAGKELIAAIQTVLLGRKYVTPHLAQEVLEMLAEPRAATGRLTPRQRDVIRLLAEGRTMKEIAATLQISPRTAETHKYQALEALGLKTTADLIRYAVEHGLIPRADQA
jgi:DNA-binding NarL/FixJ family response regulator